MIFKKLFFVFVFIILLVNTSNAQCKDDSGVFKCASLLTDSVVYLNDFKVSNKKVKSFTEENGESWEIYLIQGNRYRFALCCYEGIENKVMKLYSKDVPEENPIGSTFKEGTDKSFFDFVCNKSDVYYVSIRYKESGAIEGNKLCAIGLLGYAGKLKTN
jgi:hypothetical protein